MGASSAIAALLLRGAAWLALCALIAVLARRRSAGLRYALSNAALLALLALPFVRLCVPALEFTAPELALGAAQRVAGEQAASEPSPLVVARVPPPLVEGPAAMDAGRGLLFVWLAGALALLGLHLVRRLALARLVRRATPLAGAPWSAALVRATAAVGLRRPVRLVESETVSVPLALGWWRPVVMLPRAARAWDEAQLDSVLRHELVHLRRGDEAWHALAVLARALHWPDPLVWFAARRLVRDREHSCDECVLDSGVPASRYARHLLAVTSELAPRRTHRYGAPAMATATEVGERVRALLESRRSGPVPASARVGLALAAALVAVPLGALQARADELEALARVRALIALREVPLDEGARVELRDALGDDRRVEPRAVPLRVGGPRQGDLPETTPGKEAARVWIQHGSASIPALLAALDDARAAAREKASWALGCLNARSSAPGLCTLLARDESANVRRIAAWALGEMEARSARGALEEALTDREAGVRAQAAHALGDVRDARAVPALLTVLGDAEPAVRERVAHALGDIAVASSLPDLRVAREREHDAQVRDMLDWALRECEERP
ncbi:MAG: hypothetical protein EXS08_00435 [Planctomycetes bacterium]|nr:hypothetical protein [Planctomycetota bacterium]